MTLSSFRMMVFTALLLGASFSLAHGEGSDIKFRRTQLDPKFRSEGVAVADLNHDGKLDIAAGSVWYEAPDWKMHVLEEKAEEYPVKGYSPAFAEFAEDLNGDGWTDLLIVDFPCKPTWWLENPQGKPGPWVRRVCTPVTNNESPLYVDVDGDGTKDILAGYSPDPDDFDGPKRRVGFMTRNADPNVEWTIHSISVEGAYGAKRYDHGLGVGDINGDGRTDVLTVGGWWEAPAEPKPEWTFHEAPIGKVSAHMFGFDIDGDGDTDVLSSSAHAFGIWWHEQKADGSWETHLIDESYSQTHAICLADMNGDGLTDFVTGKRWYAHGGGDPGSDGAAVLKWYELNRGPDGVKWIAHTIDEDSGVGTQFEVCDVNGDGLLDVAISNKKGVYYFEQVKP